GVQQGVLALSYREMCKIEARGAVPRHMRSGEMRIGSHGQVFTERMGELVVARGGAADLGAKLAAFGGRVPRAADEHIPTQPGMHQHRRAEHCAAIPSTAWVRKNVEVAGQSESLDKAPGSCAVCAPIKIRHDTVDLCRLQAGIVNCAQAGL